MATLNLTFYDLPVKPSNGNEPNMTLSTEICSATVDIKCDIYRKFTFSLVDVQLVKQMYLPAELIATINITKAGNYNWIDRKALKDVFACKRVAVVAETTEKNNSKRTDVIGEDFYVHEVIPVYMDDSMEMKLKIYSPDKLMTLKKVSRTFVGKRIGEDILPDELMGYVKPYKSFVPQFKAAGEKTAENNMNATNSIGFNTGNMKRLKYKSVKKEGKLEEHMFPLLVQYNESFYDMLTRTCNRWGEFVFWEDGKLQIGYDSSKKNVVGAGKYYSITYPNLNSDVQLTMNDGTGKYDYEAVYEDNLTKPFEYSPWKSHHLILKELDHATKRLDVFSMRKVAAFLNTDKSMMAFLADQAVDFGVSFTFQKGNVDYLNDILNKKYFPESGSIGLPEQNDAQYSFDKEDGPSRAFSEFTELETSYDGDFGGYNADLYGKTVKAEQEASKNVALIDYDTSYPAGVKLGTIIEVRGEQYIVTGISAQTIEEDGSPKLVFSLEAIAKNENGTFYPTYLPSGHTRLSGPQRAKVVETKDPCLQNRVRVLFTWQQDDPKATPTPWIPFSASGDGAATTGRHTKDLDVILGFMDGNIERPYVMGAIQEDRSLIGATDVDLDTPWGHHLRLSDGIGNGFQKFLAGTLSPLTKTALNAFPTITPPTDFGRQRCLEGGFTLSDYYGVYTISGSTEDRNISIKSPWGDVKISAFTGITIEAPNGDVKIKGKNISLEAGNNLTLTSGTNIGKRFWPSGTGILKEPAVAAATKVLKMVGQVIDFTVLRAAVEVMFRPVEGVLEIKSNRYLKLEAGGTSTGYPDEAYKDERAMAYSQMDANGWYKTASGISDLTLRMRYFVSRWGKSYTTRYVKALDARKALDKSIKALKKYSNLSNQELDNPQMKVCNEYDELRDKFFGEEGGMRNEEGRKRITVADLGFKDDKVGSEKKSQVGPYSVARLNGKNPETIRAMRVDLKNDVVKKANQLLKAIQTLKKMELTENEVRNRAGLKLRYGKKLPKNYISAVIKAFSKENCKKSTIYQRWVEKNDFALNDQERQNLLSDFTDDNKLALARLAALNLLKEFGFMARIEERGARNEERGMRNENQAENDSMELPDLFASEDEIINNWDDKMNSLKILSLPGNGLAVKIGDIKKTALNIKDNWTWKSFRERNVWSDAKDGLILFSSGATKARSLDGVFNNIDTFYSKGQLNRDDVLDSDLPQVREFNKTVLEALKKFSVQRDQAAEQPLVERIENDLVVMEHAQAEGEARNEEGGARNEAGNNPQAANAGANPQAAVPPQREEPNQHIIDDEDFVISV